MHLESDIKLDTISEITQPEYLKEKLTSTKVPTRQDSITKATEYDDFMEKDIKGNFTPEHDSSFDKDIKVKKISSKNTYRPISFRIADLYNKYLDVLNKWGDLKQEDEMKLRDTIRSLYKKTSSSTYSQSYLPVFSGVTTLFCAVLGQSSSITSHTWANLAIEAVTKNNAANNLRESINSYVEGHKNVDQGMTRENESKRDSKIQAGNTPKETREALKQLAKEAADIDARIRSTR